MTDTVQVGQQACAEIMRDAVDRVIETQVDNIAAAAELVTKSLLADGVIQMFGTGHSRSFAMEIVGRAGGLIPANGLSVKDLVMYGGVPPEEILDPSLERDPSLAARILALANVHPQDVFIIGSNSGGNGAVVELARLVKERGHPVVAVTSLNHSRQIESRHPSKLRLFELADVVIDNGGVFGDAALNLPSGAAISATSSLTSVLIAQLLVTEVCGRLLAAHQDVPVFISANVPGGDEHNQAVLAHYTGRVRLGEP
ncbi:SIS domain-containing protein [Actinoallomurus iriomotensis]|uniref:UPF0309 protein n=1 Tax=Actinoallomurus iriomotensis TaxID=478107 RepID=A0A9W6RXX2_9ACTN|nr:SIS domain-containing protein [Actinoallomurus iriomotensis]GLY83776.1 UPF0309 protein [Actinoallomurus iriomotensis]